MLERLKVPAATPQAEGIEASPIGGRSFTDIFRDTAKRCLDVPLRAEAEGMNSRGGAAVGTLFSEHRSDLDMDQARSAFKAIGWKTDGVSGHAHHDPDAPLLREVSPGLLSVRIDHRTFQPSSMLLGDARAVQQRILDAGGLRDFTPIKLTEGLYLVPYRSTDFLGLRDTHCAVFRSSEAAVRFAAAHDIDRH